jgi:CRISPR-associated endonuclease Cas1
LTIAKQAVLGKIRRKPSFGKYGLRQHDLVSVKRKIEELDSSDLRLLRRRLLAVEGRCSEFYFSQILSLFPSVMQKCDRRKTFRAYDGSNNTFNFAYELARWKVHCALINARLEPFLSFMHCEEVGKPSLACDMMELYRHLVDDFLIDIARVLSVRILSLVLRNTFLESLATENI